MGDIALKLREMVVVSVRTREQLRTVYEIPHADCPLCAAGRTRHQDGMRVTDAFEAGERILSATGSGADSGSAADKRTQVC